MNHTAVIVKDEQHRMLSECLAKQLSLPVIVKNQANEYAFGLFFEDSILKLDQQNTDIKGSIWVDFSKGKSAYRFKHQGKGKLPISRACGIKQNCRPSIIDATAGLGQDAFVLAGLGCEVLCIEQQPILAALLADGILRAQKADLWLRDIVEHLQLIQDQAESTLSTNRADVIYLDPMYPQQQNRKKTRVKKAMQIFRAFPGTASNEESLLTSALAAAQDRVVVKRPDWAKHFANIEPTYMVPGKNHRFDVYKVRETE